MQAFCPRLIARGEPKTVALVAVMRELLATLTAMISNNDVENAPSHVPLDEDGRWLGLSPTTRQFKIAPHVFV